MKFIGRKQQLEKLEKVIHSEQMSFALIYGRRRVGKSELIKQVLKQTNAKSIYYECKQTTELNNVESICNLLSDLFNLPKLGFHSIEDIAKQYLIRKNKAGIDEVTTDHVEHISLTELYKG